MPFDSSMMVHFRKRLSREIIAEINNRILKTVIDRDDMNSDGRGCHGASSEDNMNPEGKKNEGIMMVDASVALADIAYPTDLSLLNHGREKLEEIIDVLYESLRWGNAETSNVQAECSS